MSRIKSILVNSALACGGIVIALVVFELGLRVANSWFPYFYCYDANRGWGLQAGASGWYTREGRSFMRINHDGFRGPDYPKAKPPSTIRIALIGDSYTEAMQVPEEQAYAGVMQSRLASCPAVQGRKVEVLDFGVDGYGTAQELATLQSKAWSYSPDMVVLAVFLGNNVRHNSVVLEGDRCRPFFIQHGDKLVVGGPFLDSPSFRLWCVTRFGYRDAGLLNLFGDAWAALNARSSGPATQFQAEAAINYEVYKPPVEPVWQDAWRVTEALITAVRDDVVNHGARFLTVTLDTGNQDWPDLGVREAFMKQSGIENLFYPDERIRALGERRGFEVLTLAQPLQAYADAHHIFLHGFTNSKIGYGHWNAAGHRVAGELIAQKICAMLQGSGPPPAPAPTTVLR